jgi:hypothetical protein
MPSKPLIITVIVLVIPTGGNIYIYIPTRGMVNIIRPARDEEAIDRLT